MSEERVAIVTGASSGIGEAAARCLADAGFGVALVARRGPRLEALAKQIETRGGRALPIEADLSDRGATACVVSETQQTFGRIDVLVNNAGYSPAAAIEQLTRDEVRHTFDVNLLSGLQLIGDAVPVMREQGGGRIINMGSLASSVQAPLAVVYSATKAGIEAATRCLRLELAPWNIQLSLIIPGFVDTPTFDNSRAMSQELRADASNPYRQLMFDLDEFAKAQLKHALPAEAVGAVVARAATARRPREVYYAPRSARLQRMAFGALPERWADRLLNRVYRSASPSA
ncbi:MAG: SDR family NAD(P)-dependent oxidoreductase [Deltaproteobacteria bacterium]|nr:SDR family NAD(P)-dependent oxidoreductase [Deltaproteobacteria bacterium]MBW2362273.1 SDR family NAD(P)-dependent oxidoreductase [Deltaproteobacteria bacterium]